MSAASAAAPEDARDFWTRTRVGWHVVFFALLALVAVTTLADEASAGQRWWVAALVTAMAVSYATVGARSLFEDRSGRGLAYLMVAWPALAALVAVTPAAYTMLFILVPQVWSLLPPRWAVAWTAAWFVVLGVVVAAKNDFSADAVGATAVFVVVQVVLSAIFGFWIRGVVRESEHRASLIEQLRATRSELAEVERSRGILAERERLAREIHDTLAQGFTSVLALAQAAEAALPTDPATVRERLVLLERTARDNLAEARTLVAALGPADLQGASLAEALERLAHRFAAETGVAVTVDAPPPGVPLSANAEVVLVRAAQEALANVRRHAGARSVRLRLVGRPDGVALEVRDDGRGFGTGTASGFGLESMRARVGEVGGTVDVKSAAGAGTAVLVTVPST